MRLDTTSWHNTSTAAAFVFMIGGPSVAGSHTFATHIQCDIAPPTKCRGTFPPPRYDVVERFLGKLPLSGRRPPPWRPRLDLPRKSAPFDPQVRPGIPLCNAGRNADTGKFQQSLSAIQVDMSVVHESVETRLDPEALARSGGRIHVPPPRIGLGWDGTTDAVRR